MEKRETDAAPDVPAADTVALELSAPATATSNTPIDIVLTIRNVSGRAIDLHLGGREVAFDIVVLDDTGREVWRRLAGKTTPSILQLVPLAAADSLVLRDRWNGAMPGSYRISAEVPTDATPLQFPPITIDIQR